MIDITSVQIKKHVFLVNDLKITANTHLEALQTYLKLIKKKRYLDKLR